MASTNSDFRSGKTSQKRKDIDDMNKSIDSIDDMQVFDSAEEASKVPILATLKQIKGQEPKIQLWNMRSGELIKTIDSRHKGPITGIGRTQDFKLVTISKDTSVNIYF